jgi:four helix bundle protein
MIIRNYRDLVAWQRAMDLVAEVYRVTQSFPKDEVYALTAQMRRAAVSVPSNIAEGQGRGNPKELVHFSRIAHGSLCELETQLLIAERLSYMAPDKTGALLRQTIEVGRLLNGLIKSLTKP